MRRPMTTVAAMLTALLTAVLIMTVAACSPPGRQDPAKTRAASGDPSVADQPQKTSAPPPAPDLSPVTEIPTRTWRISDDAALRFGISPGTRKHPPIEGFADRTSVAGGEQVHVYVSTSAPQWRATAYRMGWYGGARGARVWRGAWHPGGRQPAAQTATALHTVVAPWQPSLTVDTTGWRPGAYLIRLTTIDHRDRYVPLIVRSTSTRDQVVLLAPDTTWQAYNDWGGRNLYWGPKGKGDTERRSRAVSFDRPYAYGKGAGEFLGRMLPVVALAERLQLPLAYADDVDLERDPHLLDGARAVISMGHDEYYSIKMRENLEGARDAGTNLAFLGANAIYRRIRFESTTLGENRLVINYKDAAEDPMSLDHPKLSTADWPSPPAADPESSLIGSSYACFPAHGDLVVAQPDHWIFAGTGLHKGSKIRGALGPEFDAVVRYNPTPKPLDIVMRSPAKCGRYRQAHATYYSASSGAGVFATGTMGWVAGLNGPYGARTQKLERQITTTVLKAFAAGPAGRAYPATGR